MEFIGHESLRRVISTNPDQKLMLDQFEVIKTILDTTRDEAKSREDVR